MNPSRRRLLYENQRRKLEEQVKSDLEEIKKKGTFELGLDRFVSKKEDKVTKLASETVGLVHLDEFQKIKEGALLADDTSDFAEKKVKDQRKFRLSFDSDADEGDDDDELPGKRARLVMANPDTVLTDKQPLIIERKTTIPKDCDLKKDQKIRLNCSFWDGTDRRFILEAKKGDTVQNLLELAQVAFPPLKGSLVSSIIFVKDNVILPHDTSVLELEGVERNSPIFSFVPDENKMLVDSSKNCKIVLKSWYERSKDSWPAKQWTFLNKQ